MSRNPEVVTQVVSLTKAELSLIGALARTQLKGAILEAINAERTIWRKEQLKGDFADSDLKTYVQPSHAAYCLARTRKYERWGFLGRALGSPVGLNQIEREKDELVARNIIIPFYGIYESIEGRKPNPLRPWLGELLIKAAADPQTTEAAHRHLERFGLDPKILVEEVNQALSGKLQPSLTYRA